MGKIEILETMKIQDLRTMADSLKKISPTKFGLLVTSLQWHANRIEQGEFTEEFTEFANNSTSTLSECYKT